MCVACILIVSGEKAQ